MYSLKHFIKIFFEEQRFLLFLLFIITIYPLLNVGLITGDDFSFYLDSQPLFNETGFNWALLNGRFYYVFMKWIYSVPYIIDSPVYFSFMHLFPIFLYMFLFVWLMDRMFSDRKLTLLIALLATLFYQVTPWHSMTASHPFYYSFSLSLMLIAFHLLYSYIKTTKYCYLLLASVVFAITTLFYESYLMFYIVIFILIISRYRIKTLFTKEKIKQLTLELLPFILFGMFYIIAYFVFTHYYPSSYNGTSFSSDLTFQKFFKCINKLNRHALPAQTFSSFKDWIFPAETEFTGFFSRYFVYLKEAAFLSWLKGFIAVYLYGWLFYKFSTKLSYKRILYVFLLGFVIMYIPHIPLAFTVQFTTTFWAAWVTTGISFLGLLMVFTAAFFALNKLLLFKEILRKTIVLLLLIPLFVTTVLIQEANTGITNDLKRAKLRMDAVDGLLDSYKIKTGDIYYVKNLYKSSSILATGVIPKNFWVKYFKRKKGIVVKDYENYEKLYHDYSEKDSLVNLIFFEQPKKGNDMIISIVKCKGTQLTPTIEDIKSDVIDVGYYSDNKKFAISILSDSICNVMINNELISSQHTFHYANIAAPKKQTVTFFSINGKNIIYNTLMIKNTPFENIDFIGVVKF